MKFLRNREALFMIPELPLVEDRYNTYSSSFTAGASATKPTTRKTVKKKIKKKMSSVHTSLVNALSIVDSRQGNLFPDVSKNNNKTCPLFCEQNSVATASTADLSDDENDISLKGSSSSSESDSDENIEGKREKRGAALLVPKAPLLKGSRRWGEQIPFLVGGCDDQHYLYANVRRLRRDSPPVCPVRWKE